MYSTVFFIDGNPYGYKLTRTSDGTIDICPASGQLRSAELPELKARCENGDWQISGTDNQSLIDQVTEELNKNSNLFQFDMKTAP